MKTSDIVAAIIAILFVIWLYFVAIPSYAYAPNRSNRSPGIQSRSTP